MNKENLKGVEFDEIKLNNLNYVVENKVLKLSSRIYYFEWFFFVFW